MPTPMQNLEADRDKFAAMVDELQAGFTSLLSYMQSPKFTGAGNNYVNTQDIIDRIREIRSNVADVEMLPFGEAHVIKGIGVPSAWDYSCTIGNKHHGACGYGTYNPSIDPFTGKRI